MWFVALALALAQAATPAQSPTAWQVARTPVKGSIAAALVSAIPGDGSVVAAQFARVIMWDVDLRRGVDAGDEMAVAWRKDDAGEIEIGAVRYRSQRLQRTIRAFRYQAPGDQHPSFWDETGEEIPHRLKSGPLRNYDQITALLKDRPTHAGMDFKTPVGTPIHAPRAGVVTRANWKLKGNGNCLEMRFDDGVLAKFLHLSALKASPGARVKAGQIIALTGNTGRSTAPHLHYQLNRGPRVVDPVEYHGTARRRLDAAAMKGLTAVVAEMERVLGPLSAASN